VPGRSTRSLGIMDTKHLDELRAQLRRLSRVAPPQPWRAVATVAVGGLRAIGFDRTSELLLVVSSSGRGVFDCASGTRVARDDEEYYEGERTLEAPGVGPLEGMTVRMSGLFGGGLPTMSADGWSIEVITLDWPEKEVLLLPPKSNLFGTLYGRPPSIHKIASDSELRACGFSYSGRSLVIATTSDLTIYGRHDG